MLNSAHMKTLKVYDSTHTAVKVLAAQHQRSVTNIASSLLLFVIGKINDGTIKISEMSTQEEEEELESVEG